MSKEKETKNKKAAEAVLGPSMMVRRPTVMGEQYDPSQEDEDDSEIETFPKSDVEKDKIKGRIKNMFLFKVLDDKELDEVVDAMNPCRVEIGEVIIREGDEGDFFYVVDTGIFRASIKDKEVSTYEDEGCFGELALLYNQPRAATVTAVTEGRLWTVSRSTFNRLVRKRAYEKRQGYMRIMESVPELQPLSQYEKLQVCDALVARSAKKGEVVFEMGDDADGMYFVVDGSVGIIKDGEEVDELHKGDYFGELALVMNQPRAASVHAKEETKLAFLDVKAFERLLGPCKKIMERKIKSYKT